MTDDVDSPEFRRAFLRDSAFPAVIRRTNESLDVAGALRRAGYRSAAFVWAVRSAEIFFRDGLLFALEYDRLGDVTKAMNAARDIFGSGKWAPTVKRIRKSYGLEGSEHDVLTESGEDAWVYWRREGVGRRGEVVHGRDEIEDDETVDWAIAFVEQLRRSFTLRVIASDTGPFANVFRSAYEQASAAYRREQEGGGGELARE